MEATMSTISNLKNIAMLGALAAAVIGLSSEAQASDGCAALNGNIDFHHSDISGVGFNAGDVVTITITSVEDDGAVALNLFDPARGAPIARISNSDLTYTFQDSTSGAYKAILSGAYGSSAKVSCVAGGGGGTTNVAMARATSGGQQRAAKRSVSATDIAQAR